MYGEKVMEHFRNPRNMGKIEDADGIGKVGNPTCGDVMWLYIKVDGSGGKNVITNVKFSTFGCASAIATSSVVTELVKGKTLDEAMSLTKDDVVKALGGLPSHKIHCSLLGIDALNEALYDYFLKNNIPVPEKIAKRHELIVRHSKKG